MHHHTVFVELQKPAKIGELELKNRIVMAPMVSRSASAEGSVTDKTIAHYSQRAHNNLGLIIVEAIIIDSSHGPLNGYLALDDDCFIPVFRKLTDAIHREGAKVAAQILYPHLLKFPPKNELCQAGPSDVDMPNSHGGPHIALRELSVDQIKRIVSCYAEAAVRMNRAGFDGIEVHAAHGYLLPRFISPALNKRTDQYGGSPENRVRFLTDVIHSIKQAVGKEFPVWCRINAVEHHIPGGATIEQTQEICPMIQEAGVDAIHVSAPFSWIMPRGAYVNWASSIKNVIEIPVIAVGNLDLALGEQIIREGKADLIALGKPLLADAGLVTKTLDGREEDIVPCIHCFKCLTETWAGKKLACSVNPTLLKGAYDFKPAAMTKRVLVIGGGPSGLQAAITAASRGHRVVLCEKEDRLGGQLWPACKLSYKKPVMLLIEYFKKQLHKLEVTVLLCTQGTAEIVEQIKPDTIIVATGIRPRTPEIPGINKDNVVFAQEVLEEQVPVGDKVAVIGAEQVGCEVAEFLADKGKKVILMRRGAIIASNSSVPRQIFIRGQLAKKGIAMMPGVVYQEIIKDGIAVTDSKGKPVTVMADTIVIAAGSYPDDELFKLLKNRHSDVHRVGDCVEARDIQAAISEGFEIACSL